METWEHMTIRADSSHNPQFVITGPVASGLGQTPPTIGSAVELLNKLGAEGWQLVSAGGVSGDGKDGRYWLKRIAPTVGGGWVTGI